MILILSDLGLTKDEPGLGKASRLWLSRNSTADGGFSQTGKDKGHLCITGNSARALVKLGYVEHPKVTRAFRWLVETQAELGGW
ncbi:MAG TPA: hypothetical protein VFE91_04610, partial [Nitrososphaerales archaeon]|nr:hypothetical protein [Nitrososphaerales archaeon]